MEQETGNRQPETGNRKRSLDVGADIARRLLKVGGQSLRLGAKLPRTAIGRHVAFQLVRAATGAGANYEEARAAESRADFIHKVALAAKEAREAAYWLALIHEAGWTDSSSLLHETTNLAAILGASARTARSRAPTR